MKNSFKKGVKALIMCVMLNLFNLKKCHSLNREIETHIYPSISYMRKNLCGNVFISNHLHGNTPLTPIMTPFCDELP